MRLIIVPIAIFVIAAYGVWEGFWTDRWSLSHQSQNAAAKLASIPPIVGDWVGQDHELDSRQVARAEMTGYLLRHYTHKQTGATVQLLLVCGRAGPTSLHPPDVCYQGAGYNLDAPAVRHSISLSSSTSKSDFWVGRFQKNGASPDPLRIYWSWSATGDWIAADNPRWTFGGSPFLYKLYVIRTLSKLDEPLTDDPASDFLRQFLPQLRDSLFSDTGRPVTSVWRQAQEILDAGRWSC